MSTGAPTGNLKRLIDAGFTFNLPLPQPYLGVIQGLSPTEVDALIGASGALQVANKLRDAQQQAPPGTQPYSDFFVHPPF
jgi:hypothetical protein